MIIWINAEKTFDKIQHITTEIKNTVPFTITQKILAKVQDSYAENYIMLMKEFKDLNN